MECDASWPYPTWLGSSRPALTSQRETGTGTRSIPQNAKTPEDKAADALSRSAERCGNSGVDESSGGWVSSSSVVARESVFRRVDYILFGALLLSGLVALIGFLTRWSTLEAWHSHAVMLAVVTALGATFLANHVFRWLLLPGMRRPTPMPARTGWSVGVATTFVSGVESLEMLEETVRALVAMEYPHETWVLDEADDERVRALCRRLGTRHFSRRFQTHYQAEEGPFQTASKHGNYNAWLCEVGFERYEIIAVFDPDHIPERSFLTSVLGYFDDPGVGYVQAPQVYYNTQANFIARGAAEEVDPFYSCVQMSSYAAGHPILIGCHNTHRAAALKQVGGFAPHLADDLMLTLLYRRRGWRGVYVPQVLARGLSPVDWGTYLRQQRRWAHAVLDLKLRIYPRLVRDLPLGTRILGLLHGISFLGGPFLNCALIVWVCLALLWGVDINLADGPLLTWGGGVLAILVLGEAFQRRFYLERRRGVIGLRWRAALVGFAKWPQTIWALVDVLLGRRLLYGTTPKVRVPTGRVTPLWPHAATIGAVCAATLAASAGGGRPTPFALTCGVLLVALSVHLLATEWWGNPEPYPGARCHRPTPESGKESV